MNKIFLTAIFAIGLMSLVNAQKSTWGIRTGMNISTLSENVDDGPESDYKNKIGFRFGVIGDFGLSENFYIQPGLYFTTLGAKLEIDDDDATVNLNYLQLPVLASYRIPVSDALKVHFNAGPYIAYGVSGKLKYDGIKTDAFGTDESDGGLSRFDAGLSFGLGLSINAAYVGVGYDFGLTNMLNDDVWETDDVSTKNRNFFITIGYNF